MSVGLLSSPRYNMELPRLSTPSVNIYDFSGDYGRHSSSYISPATSRTPFSARSSMVIPSKQIPGSVPPPLPPPTRITDLEKGHDTGWLHANSGRLGATRLPPISSTSSLLGGHDQPTPDDQVDPMMVDGPQLKRKRPKLPEARFSIESPWIHEGSDGHPLSAPATAAPSL